MSKPAPRTLTEKQQLKALAGGNRQLDFILRDLRRLQSIMRSRIDQSCDAITSMPASGVDEIHGRTTQPSAEAAMEFLIGAQQELRSLLGFPPVDNRRCP